ncbi:hypothetical protein [Streptomyces swartbergensis]|uniref:hypothetical protein n=1 Tax=Streptomyces swartbergensis TaxID=487165 RepID=UPI00117C65CC|nr:hypothetical protein [Streptomyces swartbergensis]
MRRHRAAGRGAESGGGGAAVPRSGRCRGPAWRSHRNALLGEVPQERQRAAEVSDGHLPELLPVLD